MIIPRIEVEDEIYRYVIKFNNKELGFIEKRHIEVADARILESAIKSVLYMYADSAHKSENFECVCKGFPRKPGVIKRIIWWLW